MLEAIYAVFSEGWSDPAGTELRRRNLAEEGIWLGRLVVSLLPEEPEALGLLALMLHAEARRIARRDDAGDYVPLAEQDVGRWNEGDDRGGGSAAVSRRQDGRHRPLSARGGGAIGPCRAPALGQRRLGGHRASLRLAVDADRFASRGDQSGDCRGRDQGARSRGWRSSTGLSSTISSAAINPIGLRAPRCWRAPEGDEEAGQAYDMAIGLESRSGGAPLPAAQEGGQGRLARAPNPSRALSQLALKSTVAGPPRLGCQAIAGIFGAKARGEIMRAHCRRSSPARGRRCSLSLQTRKIAAGPPMLTVFAAPA